VGRLGWGDDAMGGLLYRNRLGRSVYGPYFPYNCRGVSVSVWAAAGRLLWWGGGVRCFVG